MCSALCCAFANFLLPFMVVFQPFDGFISTVTGPQTKKLCKPHFTMQGALPIVEWSYVTDLRFVCVGEVVLL